MYTVNKQRSSVHYLVGTNESEPVLSCLVGLVVLEQFKAITIHDKHNNKYQCKQKLFRRHLFILINNFNFALFVAVQLISRAVQTIFSQTKKSWGFHGSGVTLTQAESEKLQWSQTCVRPHGNWRRTDDHAVGVWSCQRLACFVPCPAVLDQLAQSSFIMLCRLIVSESR